MNESTINGVRSYAAPVRTPNAAVMACFRKAFDFRGRASRSEFWWFFLFVNICDIFAHDFISSALAGSGYENAVNLTVDWALLIPWVAVCMRRLHDCGRSARFMLLAGPYIALLVLPVDASVWLYFTVFHTDWIFALLVVFVPLGFLLLMLTEKGIGGEVPHRNGRAGEASSSRSFIEAVRVCLRQYADFSGRASRSEFWWFHLFFSICGTLAQLSGYFLFAGTDYEHAPMLVVNWMLIIPWAAACMRRLHDCGRTARFMLLAGPFVTLQLLPFAPSLWLFNTVINEGWLLTFTLLVWLVPTGLLILVLAKKSIGDRAHAPLS